MLEHTESIRTWAWVKATSKKVKGMVLFFSNLLAVYF